MASDFEWQQRVFNETLRRYLPKTSRTLPDALNTKSFFIGRRSVIETPRADKSEILALRERAVIGTGTRNGKAITIRESVSQTRAARIIQARQAKEGKDPLKGRELSEEVRKFLGARLRSRAYLASGWLPGIRIMEMAVDPKYRRGAPRNDRTAAVSGRPKGGATPARPGFRCTAIIENSIGIQGLRHSTQTAARDKYAAPALGRSFAYETQSINDYIAARMKPDADEFNRAQKR